MVFSLLLSLLVQTLDPVVIHMVQYKFMTFVANYGLNGFWGFSFKCRGKNSNKFDFYCQILAYMQKKL